MLEHQAVQENLGRLRDLGVRNMRVLSAPKQMHGLSAFGLEVAEYVD